MLALLEGQPLPSTSSHLHNQGITLTPKRKMFLLIMYFIPLSLSFSTVLEFYFGPLKNLLGNRNVGEKDKSV